jgi:hypothetical protein
MAVFCNSLKIWFNSSPPLQCTAVMAKTMSDIAKKCSKLESSIYFHNDEAAVQLEKKIYKPCPFEFVLRKFALD